MNEFLDLTLIRVLVGALMAAHGAQKVFGAWNGPGMQGTERMVGGLRFNPPHVWASLLAYGELLGGLAFALGLLTPLAASVLAVDLFVAIRDVHWSKGFWNTAGGYEFPAVLIAVFVLVGLTGGGPYSVDAQLGLAYPSPVVFIVVAGIGVAMAVPSRQRERLARLRESGRRRAA